MRLGNLYQKIKTSLRILFFDLIIYVVISGALILKNGKDAYKHIKGELGRVWCDPQDQ